MIYSVHKSMFNFTGEEEQYLCWSKAAICISCASMVFTTAFGGTFFGEFVSSSNDDNIYFPKFMTTIIDFAIKLRLFCYFIFFYFVIVFSQIAGSPAAFGFAVSLIYNDL